MRSVSVIIPVYNHAATIGEAVNSALAQEFDGDVEIVATNDGSTDRTQEVLDSYGSRIKVVRQTNSGASAALNAAVARSQGAYLAFLDADDLWLPGRLTRTVAALEENPRAVLAYSDAIQMSENGEIGQPWFTGGAPSMKQLLSSGCMMFPSAATIRRSAFDACGGFEERLPRYLDAYFFMLAREQGEFEYIAEPLMIYRQTNHALLADKYVPVRRTFLRILRARYGRTVARQQAKVTAQLCASLLTSKASMQSSKGAHFAALWTFTQATWLMPSYIERVSMIKRLFCYAAKKLRARISRSEYGM